MKSEEADHECVILVFNSKWASANDSPVSYKGIMPILPVGWLAMYFPEQIIYSYRFGDYRLATEQIVCV